MPCLCGAVDCPSCGGGPWSEPEIEDEDVTTLEGSDEEDPRERDEDDGSSYADPRDEMDDRLGRD